MRWPSSKLITLCCKDCGEISEVEVGYTPATRWEPEDVDDADQECGYCGGELLSLDEWMDQQ